MNLKWNVFVSCHFQVFQHLKLKHVINPEKTSVKMKEVRVITSINPKRVTRIYFIHEYLSAN